MNEAKSPAAAVDESLRRRFEAAWRRGDPEPIERCLPPADDARYLATLEELIKIDLDFRWRIPSAIPDAERGQTDESDPPRRPQVEDYLPRFPQLRQPEILLGLLREECLVRTVWDDRPDMSEYRRRFPELEIPEWDLDASFDSTGIGETRLSARTPADTQSAGGSPDHALPIDLGNYELLDELGRGGMGVVYRARQKNADRVVALKVIRRDLLRSLAGDTHSGALERFRHEVQAAARLEHENIVSVYEVSDLDGEPFFSMQFVEGPSLAEVLRDGPLENRRAASYLEQVARAVAEAHREGIFHRDLKPQNILVDEKTGRPLVADFGLAKLQESGDELTHSGDIMGSPPYMSPEQATDSSRVSGQSDVYSLGATLYHLLTGRPPFQAATRVETIQQVINEEPAPPRQLNILIDRDLETICLKCLEKPLVRRYASAEMLADELRRYLDHKPIQARPVGPVSRAWRWCQRNPVTAASLTLAVAFLVTALIAATVGYVQTSASLKVATQAKRESDESFQLARNAVDRFLTHVGENELLDQPGMQPLRRELLEEAARYYQQFLTQRAHDPAVRDELAAAHFRVGRIHELLGDHAEAFEAYRRARTIQRQLCKESPQDPARLAALGDTANGIGRVLTERRDLDGALSAHGESLQVRQKLADLAPDVTDYQRTLANTHMNVGLAEMEIGKAELSDGRAADCRLRFDEARQSFRKAEAIRAKLLASDPQAFAVRRDQAQGFFNSANLELHAGELPASSEGGPSAQQCFALAEEYLESAIQIFSELLQTDAGHLENQYRLALCQVLLADLKGGLGEIQPALELYEQAHDRLEPLVVANPGVAKYRGALAGIHMNKALRYGDREQLEAAVMELSTARDLLEPLTAAPRYRRNLQVALLELAGHLEQLVEAQPDNDTWRRELEETQHRLQALRASGDDEG